MLVSVIVPVYNEEKYIEGCLKSLSLQSYKPLEIIVVDDGSRDNSKLKIKNAKLKFKMQDLKLLEQEHKGSGEARNLGAKYAKGEVLVFVDADMEFDKDFIKELVAPIIKGKLKGTFSKEEYVANWDNVWARCWNYNQGLKTSKRLPPDYPDRAFVFRAILKSEFEKVKGFESIGYTDDWTLSEKLGYQAVLAKGARYYHYNPDNLWEVFLQARWIGKRRYKLGILGNLVSLLRSSLPLSLIKGVLGSIYYKEACFLPFKLIYDLGIFTGALESLLKRKRYK